MPLVGVPADRRELSPHLYHMAGEKYLSALLELSGVLPVVVPVLAPVLDSEPRAALLAHCDGLLLTGSYSNVEPARYGGSPSVPGTLHDPARDALTLALIPEALRIGMPVLAICRGFQEMNVALGGSLHQRVHELPGMLDHREDTMASLDVQYGPAHEVSFTPGGLLAELTGLPGAPVNSVHWQGVDRLAPGLRVEASAPDGLVEAFTLPTAPGFNLAVQWHPEWRAADNPVSRAIFIAFGEACRQYRQCRAADERQAPDPAADAPGTNRNLA